MRKISMLIVAMVIVSSFSTFAQVTNNVTITPAAANYCEGDNITVNFDASGFGSGNSFSVEISDDNFSGNIFPLTGSINSTGGIGLSIAVTLPAPLSGSNHSVRVVGTNPVGTSTPGSLFGLNALPDISVGAATETVCENQSLSLSASSTTPGAIFSWSGPTGFSDPQQNSGRANMQLADAGDYIVTATANGCSANDTTVVSVTALPNITVGAANMTVCENQTLNLTSNSTTVGASFSWSGPSAFSSNQQNPNRPNMQLVDAGVYTVTATANGCQASATTTVGVTPLPNLSVSSATLSICLNQTLNLSASSTTPGATFSWAGPNGFSSNSATPSILGILLNGAGVYTVTATAASCSTSLTQTVTVNTLPAFSAGADKTICAGFPNTNLSAQLTPQNGAASYSWAPSTGLSNTGIQNPVASPGSTTTYTLTATDGNGCSNTDNVIVTVIPTPSVNPIATTPFCPGQQVILNLSSPTVGPAAVNYTWDPQLIVGFTAAGSPGTTINFNANNSSSSAVSGMIRVTPFITFNSVTCNGLLSDVSFVTVNPAPVVTPTSDMTVCNDENVAQINFSNTLASNNQWQSFGDVISTSFPTPAPNTLSSFMADIADSTAQQTAMIVVTPDPVAGCQGATDTFNITVRPTPIVNPVADTVYCENVNTAPVAFTSPIMGVNYTWTSSVNGIGLLGSGIGNIPFFQTINNGNAPVTTTITITPSLPGCSNGVVDSFHITVNPKPKINPIADPAPHCNGSTNTRIDFTTPNTGVAVSYSWVGTDPAIGLGLSGTDSIPTFTATNSGINLESSQITVRPKIAGCADGDPMIFNIRVYPTPNINPFTAQSVCNGATVAAINIDNATNISLPISYTWTNSNAAIGLQAGPVSGSFPANIPSFTAVNNTSAPVTSTVTVTPKLTGCPNGPNKTMTITVKPTPKLTSPLSDSVCSDATFNYSASSSVAGTSYTWQRLTAGNIGPLSSSGPTISQQLSSAPAHIPVPVTYVATLNAASCTSDTELRVLVLPVASTPGFSIPDTICAGSPFITIKADRQQHPGEKFTWGIDATGVTAQIVDTEGMYAIVKGSTGSVITLQSMFNSNGCSTPQHKGTINLTASTNGDPRIIRKGDNLICLANKAGSGVVESYQWGRTDTLTLVEEFLFGNNLEQERGQEYHLTAKDDLKRYYYWVIVRFRNDNSCKRKVYFNTPKNLKIVPEEAEESPADFKMYPNPAQEALTIELASIEGKNTIEVRDIMGKLVGGAEVQAHKTTLPLAQLASGCYFITWRHNGQMMRVEKLIKN
jgi:hypothetical protein